MMAYLRSAMAAAACGLAGVAGGAAGWGWGAAVSAASAVKGAAKQVDRVASMILVVLVIGISCGRALSRVGGRRSSPGVWVPKALEGAPDAEPEGPLLLLN